MTNYTDAVWTLHAPDGLLSQEKTKTLLMQKLRGQTESMMVFSKVPIDARQLYAPYLSEWRRVEKFGRSFCPGLLHVQFRLAHNSI